MQDFPMAIEPRNESNPMAIEPRNESNRPVKLQKHDCSTPPSRLFPRPALPGVPGFLDHTHPSVPHDVPVNAPRPLPPPGILAKWYMVYSPCPAPLPRSTVQVSPHTCSADAPHCSLPTLARCCTRAQCMLHSLCAPQRMCWRLPALSPQHLLLVQQQRVAISSAASAAHPPWLAARHAGRTPLLHQVVLATKIFDPDRLPSAR